MTLLTMSTQTGCRLLSEQKSSEPGPRYSTDLPKGEIFDVQVFRQSTLLKMTNTTTRDFGPSRIWLNQRYSQTIDGFASGQTLELELITFVDEFGETYRAGGFFSQRSPAPVVLCQIEVDEGNGPILHGFIVVENSMD